MLVLLEKVYATISVKELAWSILVSEEALLNLVLFCCVWKGSSHSFIGIFFPFNNFSLSFSFLKIHYSIILYLGGILARVPVSIIIKHHAKSSLGRKGLIFLTFPHHSSTTEGRQGPGGEAGAEGTEEGGALECSSWLPACFLTPSKAVCLGVKIA